METATIQDFQVYLLTASMEQGFDSGAEDSEWSQFPISERTPTGYQNSVIFR